MALLWARMATGKWCFPWKSLFWSSVEKVWRSIDQLEPEWKYNMYHTHSSSSSTIAVSASHECHPLSNLTLNSPFGRLWSTAGHWKGRAKELPGAVGSDVGNPSKANIHRAHTGLWVVATSWSWDHCWQEMHWARPSVALQLHMAGWC